MRVSSWQLERCCVCLRRWNWRVCPMDSLGHILLLLFAVSDKRNVHFAIAPRSTLKTQNEKMCLCSFARSSFGTERMDTHTLCGWNENGYKIQWLRRRRNATYATCHAITFIYLIFDQFILIKSSPATQFAVYGSGWEFWVLDVVVLVDHLAFCINKILFILFCGAISGMVDTCEWIRQNDDSNDVDDDYTKVTA